MKRAVFEYLSSFPPLSEFLVGFRNISVASVLVAVSIN